MKKTRYPRLFLLSLASALYFHSSFSQTIPQFTWATNSLAYFNGTTSWANYGTAICTDEVGNNYTLGFFNGTIYFDTCTLSSSGLQNHYMVSYDASGNFRWGKQFTGVCTSITHDMVYDHAGHIYATGSFSDSISFNGINYYSAGQLNSYYIARFDTAGNFEWAKIILPKAASPWISNIHLSADNLHNVYAAGRYSDTLLIDGNNMNIPETDNFYFAKFDSSGILNFIKSGYASNMSSFNNLQIAHDSQSHIYLTGRVTDSVCIQSVTMTGMGMFMAGFDANGNYKWMNIVPGNTVTGTAIQTVDNLLYVAGFYNDSLSIGTTTFYTPTIIHNTFLAQFDTTGAFYWAKRMDVIAGNQARINSMVATGNYIYVAGEFTKSLIFNGIQYSSTTPIFVARDPYVAAYDPNGNEVWFKGAGSFHEDYGYDIDIDSEQNIYLTGSTHFPSYFDSITLTDSIGGIGGNNIFDSFIAKIDHSSVISVPDISASPQVTVYPNPLTTQSKIAFSNPQNQKFIYTLTDITGRIVEIDFTETSEIILTKGSKSAGVYLFNLVNEQTGQCMNGKIVVSE